MQRKETFSSLSLRSVCCQYLLYHLHATNHLAWPESKRRHTNGDNDDNDDDDDDGDDDNDDDDDDIPTATVTSLNLFLLLILIERLSWSLV